METGRWDRISIWFLDILECKKGNIEFAFAFGEKKKWKMSEQKGSKMYAQNKRMDVSNREANGMKGE